MNRSTDCPNDPVEERLCVIFGELLGVRRIRTGDSFFALGGHSLLATLLLSRIYASFNVELALPQILRTPTVRDLALAIHRCQKMAGLSVKKRQLLERRLSRLATGRAEAITPQPATGPFPLSYSQRQLWLVDQVEGGSPFYNISAAVRFGGELEVTVLQRALSEIVRRHEVLRTAFTAVGGEPRQMVQPPQPLSLPLADLTALPEERRQDEARRLAVSEAAIPFDLECAPLLRCRLLRLDRASHVLTCVMHHIVSDGWSLGVLARELDLLYGAFRLGAPSPLQELPIQYRHYTIWQRRLVNKNAIDSGLSYWRQQLADVPTFLPLPTDLPRPAIQSFGGAEVGFDFPLDLQIGLRDLAVHEGCSLFLVLLATLQILLYQLTGLDDIVVSAPFSGREQSETQGLIGLFVRTVLFRLDLSGNPSFRETLARLRRVAAEAVAHQHIPLEQIIQEVVPGRVLSHSPFLQVALNVLDFDPSTSLETFTSGLTVVPFEFETRSSQNELTLVLAQAPHAWRGTLQYRTGLFETGTIELWIDQFKQLLGRVSREPDTDLRQLGKDLTVPEMRMQKQQQLRQALLQGLIRKRQQTVGSEAS